MTIVKTPNWCMVQNYEIHHALIHIAVVKRFARNGSDQVQIGPNQRNNRP